MHLPHSPVIKSSPLHHLSRSTKTKVQLLSCTMKKALKTQLHILVHFCPSQLPRSRKKQIYSFSEMNLKDVHIKKIKPTKVQRPKIKTPSVTPMAKWSTSPKSRKLPMSIY